MRFDLAAPIVAGATVLVMGGCGTGGPAKLGAAGRPSHRVEVVGCPAPPVDPSQETLVELWRDIQKLDADGDGTALQALAAAHPDTAIGALVKRLLTHEESRRAAARELNRSRGDLRQSLAERDRLTSDVARLEAALAALEKLAIETERRAD